MKEETQKQQVRDARALHARAIVIDAACPLAIRAEYLSSWMEGGTTALAPTLDSFRGMPDAMQSIAHWLQRIEERSDQLLHVIQAEDILRAKREGKLGLIFHFQNTDPIEDNLALLRVYHRVGVRIIQLTYNRKNRVGDGCEERTDCGLSRFGVRLIHEMNRLGIIVDLSHTGYRTTMEAMEIAEAPPIFSHSNCKAVCDSPRNLTDEQIRAVAARGGVIGMNGFPSFVANVAQPTLEHFLAHIDHIAELVGPEHIGLGLDYYEGMASVATAERAQALYEDHIASGIWTAESYPAPPWHFPAGLEMPSGFPHLTEALIDRGYSDDDIEKILGSNFLRVFHQVWG